VHAHNHTGSDLRAPKQCGRGPFAQAPVSGRLDTFPVARDGGNSTEQMIVRNRGIGAGHRISLGLNGWVPAGVALRQHAVDHEAISTAKQHDIAFGDIMGCGALNPEHVAWPDGRQHAAASGTNPQASAGTQYLTCHVAFEGASVERRRSRIHDARVFPAQVDCVTLIFPHESADVTNTCS
jgi:hypothetical protein